MKFSLKIGDLTLASVEALLIFGWEDGWPKQTDEIDHKLGGLLTKEALRREFKAETGKLLPVSTLGKILAEKIILVGLGKKEEFTLYRARKVFATIAKYFREQKIESLAFDGSSKGGKLDFIFKEKNEQSEFIQAAVEGMLLGSYQFTKYKSKEDQEKREEQETKTLILVKDARELVSTRESVTRGEIFSQATIFCRDLVNEPSSVTTPTYLADLAEKLSQKDKFNCKVYEKDEIEKLGMGALLGVARGSDEPLKFIKLEYSASSAKAGLRRTSRKIVLVGKGITFDTGGLSLKSQEGMENMKMDMAGAAAILGIFSVVGKLRPKVHLIGLIPCTENMPSGKAIKPGDIVKTYSGKTIEVVNTDAEGRLILADALAFGKDLKPDLIIDLATLTGACIVALGEDVAGLFSQEEKLAEEIEKAAEKAGEKFWPMPLEADYKELLKSEVADLKNVSGKKYAGAITAGLFLQEFVGKIPWAHLDIAGPAWQEKGTDLIPKGGSGFGVRTILNFLFFHPTLALPC